jgi:Putative collagen-binding domain of a collagenase
MNLAAMSPRVGMSAGSHVLANMDAAKAEILAYSPYGGPIDLNLEGCAAQLAVEWMNPSTGERSTAADVSGGAREIFTPPFAGDAVLYLKARPSAAAH